MPILLISVLFAWAFAAVIAISLARAAGQHAPSAPATTLSREDAA